MMDLKRGLDWKSQQTAQKIYSGDDPKALDGLATKALGILQDNGVFACVLFLHTRRKGEESLARNIMKHLHGLARDITGEEELPRDPRGYLKFYSDKICGDLDRTILIRSAWEQTLIYTRYGAKAVKGAEA